MIVLDENILEDQRQLLEAWRFPARQIGFDILVKGLKDEQILVELRRLKRPTFFTRDRGFYNRALCHRRYFLVVVEANQDETAAFIRRFLRHAAFRTQAQRTARVVRISQTGINSWGLGRRSEAFERWDPSR